MQTMNKKQLITILLCLFCAISFAQTTPAYTVKTVVIDADTAEKTLVLAEKYQKRKTSRLQLP